MTIADALCELAAIWPDDSFSVDCEVWSHVHDGTRPGDGRQAPKIEWSIYNAEERTAYRHPTLEGAVVMARASSPIGRMGSLELLRQADDSSAGERS